MNEETIKYILARVIERGYEAVEEYHEERNDLNGGRKLAYYEVLDIIKSELMVEDQDLKEFGLDVNLEKEFL